MRDGNYARGVMRKRSEQGFEPTYEGWKLGELDPGPEPQLSVLSLPMRDGNNTMSEFYKSGSEKF